jgi:peptidoglycan/LPS O-acetylase OafA/YrhL
MEGKSRLAVDHRHADRDDSAVGSPSVDAPTPAGGAATTGSGRVGNVDVLRAFAALGVLAGHAYSLGGRSVPIQAAQWYDVPLKTTATGVWLFFGISGYVISKPFVDRLLTGRRPPDLVPYALRRALRIFPLYWVALTAVIVLGGVRATNWQYAVHYALLHNLVPGREQALFGVAWTLTLEILFYCLVPLLALALHRSRRQITPERLALLVCVTWAGSIAFMALADLRGPTTNGLWLRGSIVAMWQMFCPGILLAIAPHLGDGQWRRALVGLPARRGAIAVMLVLLVVAALLGAAVPLRYGVVKYELLSDLGNPLFAIGYGLLIAMAIRTGAWARGRARFLLELGLVSYGIYLLHAVLLVLLLTHDGRRLIPLRQDTLPAFGLHLVFLAGLTIPLAMASWRWFESPLIGLSHRLSDRYRARRGAGDEENQRRRRRSGGASMQA